MKLIINKQEYDFFSDYDINLRYNAVASDFSFKGISEFIEDVLFYPEVEIYTDDGELLLTGYILIPSFNVSAEPELRTLKGYSKTGFLDDCSIPYKIYPLQSSNLTLKQIAEKILVPFGLEAIASQNVLNEYNERLKQSNAKPDQSPKDYLNGIAEAKGIILTHNEKGQLVFTRLDISKLLPVAYFTEESPGVMDISFDMNGQSLHSDITVIKEASETSPNSGEFTIQNPYCTGIYRPRTVVMTSGQTFDAEKAARKELSNELAGISLTIQTLRFVKPGQLIEVFSPTNKINEPTEFFVEETQIKGTPQSETYTLKCVLKDVYTTIDFKNIFDKTKKIQTEWGGSKTGEGGAAMSLSANDRLSLQEAVKKQRL